MRNAIVISLLISIGSYATEYSINLMWLYKKITPEQNYVFADRYKEDVILDKMIQTWAEKNPSAPVNVWFDSQYVTEQQISNSKIKIDQLNNELERKAPDLIELKDVRDLDLVKNEPDVFSDKLPVYFRADFLRLIATMDLVEKCINKCFAVYSDFNVIPMSEDELFDKATVDKLNKFGIVLKYEEGLKIENSFHIIGNNNPNLLKALNLALVDVNIQRGKIAAKGALKGVKEVGSVIYKSLRPALNYFYQLEGYGKLLINDHGKAVIYNEKKYGIEPFKPGGDGGFLGTFESENPLITKESDNPYEEAEITYPTKEVEKPKISGVYRD